MPGVPRGVDRDRLAALVLPVGALVPLWRITAFGRGYFDLWICFMLFCVAAWIALWVDRPDRGQRSIAELLAALGGVAAAARLLVVPGAAGHAAQTSPRASRSRSTGSTSAPGSLWLGGLVGLLDRLAGAGGRRRLAVLSVVVPRFSNVAFVSVAVLLAHRRLGGDPPPADPLGALDDLLRPGDHGQGLPARGGDARRLGQPLPDEAPASRCPRTGPSSALRPRRSCAVSSRGRLCLLVAAVFAAALLSSLAPPPPTLAEEGSALAQVGPGHVAAAPAGRLHAQGGRHPNQAAVPNTFGIQLTRGAPVDGADVTVTFEATW